MFLQTYEERGTKKLAWIRFYKTEPKLFFRKFYDYEFLSHYGSLSIFFYYVIDLAEVYLSVFQLLAIK